MIHNYFATNVTKSVTVYTRPDRLKTAPREHGLVPAVQTLLSTMGISIHESGMIPLMQYIEFRIGGAAFERKYPHLTFAELRSLTELRKHMRRLHQASPGWKQSAYCYENCNEQIGCVVLFEENYWDLGMEWESLPFSFVDLSA